MYVYVCECARACVRFTEVSKMINRLSLDRQMAAKNEDQTVCVCVVFRVVLVLLRELAVRLLSRPLPV